MAILKCKMCGGDLNITADVKIIECEFCGTTQTIPNGNDEKKTNLFNRANRLRMDNEFDKAAGVYESIVSEFPEEAEGYWGLVLCSYGIEYVDDAKTAKKIPTCHRTLTYSVMDDDNFVQACENADVVARGIYREEAKAIDRLQQQIIAVVENEEPYDVFICYKETDDITKQRTEDSLIAQDIYTELIKEGYKVFFSRVTLRDKAGTEYEPYIYAALKSAKIMLAIGTKFDYYDAVWVKNEWGRFLSMMSEDNSKHLIPCFKNLDAYDIPKEFKNLQALDMGEVTFFKNLTDNVERIIPKQTTEQPKVVEIQSDSNSATIDSLLKRAFMFLEDGNWKSAEEYCEKVLDINPECAEAYLGKLMVNLKVYTQEELENYNKAFYIDDNYQKFIKYGDDEKLKIKLQEINQRIIDETIANDREEFYNEGIELMQQGSISSLEKAINIFEQILNWKDSKKFSEECKVKLKHKTESFQKEFKQISSRNLQTSISAGAGHTIGLNLEGAVVATQYTGDYKYYYGRCDVGNWTDIVAISAGCSHTVGLKSDGTVISVGNNSNGQCNVSNWRNVIAISADFGHTVGLKSDGTVVATKYLKEDWETYDGQCDVEDWTDIVAVSAGFDHTIGLKSDGTVIATGNNEAGQCDVEDWTDIVAISAGSFYTIALKSDGTIIGAGLNESIKKIVTRWKYIVAISAGSNHIVGLKSDGTVVATGNYSNSRCDVEDWTDIVAISAGDTHTVGVKSNGTVIAIGNNDDGQCKVSGWKLFDNFYTIEQERATIKARIYEEKLLKVERERLKAEQEKNDKITLFVEEKQQLQAELGNLKGIFSSSKRKRIEERINQINAELEKM